MVEIKYRSCSENIAFSYPDEAGNKVSKTFGEVYHDINILESWMSAQGIRNRHIALIGENSYLWLVAFLAIVNGGNVAVPIDKGLTGDEIAGLLQKADVTMVFCADSCKEMFSCKGIFSGCGEIEILSFDEVEKICGSMEESRNSRDMGKGEDGSFHETVGRAGVGEDDVDKCCCIFFTSGTSGATKGVCLSQRNLT